MKRTFEAHITVSSWHAEVATEVAIEDGWKTSQIDGDPLLGDGVHFYLTTHGDTFEGLKHKALSTELHLINQDVPVIRKKIEQVLYDVRTP